MKFIDSEDIERAGFELGRGGIKSLDLFVVETFLCTKNFIAQRMLIASSFLFGYWECAGRTIPIPDSQTIKYFCEFAKFFGLEFGMGIKVPREEFDSYSQEEKIFKLALNRANNLMKDEL